MDDRDGWREGQGKSVQAAWHDDDDDDDDDDKTKLIKLISSISYGVMVSKLG